MRIGRLRGGLGATVAVLAVTSCGTPAPSPTVTARSTTTALPRPSAAAGPCASVTTTTAIDQVPAACATLWAPYGVTKVPPANLTDSTPPPPAVVNATNGAVSDADARAWAVAANRGAVWYRWAERFGQVPLLAHLVTQGLIPASELAALSQGAEIDEPDCSSFGTRHAFFPIGTDGPAFFSGLGQRTSAQFVLAETYPAPCQISAKYPDGRVVVLFSYSTSGTTVSGGSLRHELILGDIWCSEAAADCTTQHGPQKWCAP
jgi:hypothetical protein